MPANVLSSYRGCDDKYKLDSSVESRNTRSYISAAGVSSALQDVVRVSGSGPGLHLLGQVDVSCVGQIGIF
jgi:hypothetical protein